MKNKTELKKYLKKAVLCTLIFAGLALLVTFIEYRIYTVNFNNKIYSVLNVIKSEYPDISEDKIMEVLNSDDDTKELFLEKYGIETDKDSIVLKNDSYFRMFVVINITGVVILSFLLELFYLKHNRRKDKDIEEISSYIEQINKGNYKLNIDNNSEDELSILKNEVYKTMIMLKEGAENSKKDKLSLKDSLGDISHQLKTPLTSIIIALENLEDNPDLDIETREKFIKNIKRDINNIRFLVESILKLSKLDTNTVDFMDKNIELEHLINESVGNVKNLCDLKNIRIDIPNKIEGNINCDEHWQTEALTNIIKNAAEHADTYVKIKTENNNVYTKIMIINDGANIDKSDLKHIFERFYRGKNASKDSIGIGLALSKKIIEKDNGYIDAESENNRTTFTIKYFKR